MFSKNASLILELYSTNMYKTCKRNIQKYITWKDSEDIVKIGGTLSWLIYFSEHFHQHIFLLLMLNYCTKFILCNPIYCFTVKPHHFFIFAQMQASVYLNPVTINMPYAAQVHLQFPLLLLHIVKIYFFFFCCRSFFFSSRLRSFSFKFL